MEEQFSRIECAYFRRFNAEQKSICSLVKEISGEHVGSDAGPRLDPAAGLQRAKKM